MTAMPENSVRKRFERVTVYVDISTSSNAEEGEAAVLLRQIQVCAAALARVLVVVDSKSLVSSIKQASQSYPAKSEAVTASGDASSSLSTTVELLRFWQAEEADVYTRDVSNTVPFMRDWECLVTSKDPGDGAVAYALHHRQMPVLSLTSRQASTPTRTPKSAVEELLYTCLSGDVSLEAKRDALVHFFTFPTDGGDYVMGSPPVAAAGEPKSPRSCEADPASASAADPVVVVVVNEDGYPVRLPHTTSLLPPPPTRFAGILRTLCSADSTQMEILRQRNPLLPGILTAFHRYENRGLLRAALQRGYRVEVMRSAEGEQAASSGEDLVCNFLDLITNSSDEAESKGRKVHALSTLRRFESGWLDMPLPTGPSVGEESYSP
ncbi:hypothetical protein JKF63_00550 [Porcisia hertigi]|uniref:Uncharacterized protein n=1 Tax=Porcisia hertigi TaxID=2761500 RepID=A0A836L158_9TRYP|nr:hypothetical protein JKF63_00550 [Porcisia hertigi]